MWPKLSSARSPSSRSSAATTAAFIRQLVTTACRIGSALKRAQRIALAFAPGEKFGVADQAVFDRLGIAGEQFAARQGGERIGVGQHQARLIKGADQVFAGARVNPGLAADRAVDLGQQGRRNLHEIDAAQQCRRGKPRQIADHPAAQRHQHRAALDTARQDLLGEAAEMIEILGLLAGRQHDRMIRDPGRDEAVAQRRQPMPGDVFVGDHDRLAAAHQRQHLAPGRGDQPRPDDDVIGALGQCDAQPFEPVSPVIFILRSPHRAASARTGSRRARRAPG